MKTDYRIAIIGANGRIGKILCQSLSARGFRVIACTRSPEDVAQFYVKSSHKPYAIRTLDFSQPRQLSEALHDGAYVINTAHACYIPALLRATTAPIIALGSTRKYTQWPDDHARGVLTGERALQEDARPSIILHPTMIYGAQGENNIQRLVRLLRYLPIIPLPKSGNSLVQPIEYTDVVRCLCAALERLIAHPYHSAERIVIAGANAISYREFISHILHYGGYHTRPVISLPINVLIYGAYLTTLLPGLPKIKPAEIRRLLENKNANITDMKTKLSVFPLTFEEGVKRLFS